MTEGEKIYPKIPIENFIQLWTFPNLILIFSFRFWFQQRWCVDFRRLFLYNENYYNNYQLNKSSTLSTLHILCVDLSYDFNSSILLIVHSFIKSRFIILLYPKHSETLTSCPLVTEIWIVSQQNFSGITRKYYFFFDIKWTWNITDRIFYKRSRPDSLCMSFCDLLRSLLC